MKGHVDNIKDAAIRNSNFRQVLYTIRGMQLVVMALEPGEDIGEEVHPDRDQYFTVEKGKGEIRIDGTTRKIRKNSAMIVPAGARHNVLNIGGKVLRLATIYAPPEHQDAVVHLTKTDAQASKEHFDGAVTEPKAKAKPAAAKAKAKAKAKPAAAKPAAKPTAKRRPTRARSAATD